MALFGVSCLFPFLCLSETRVDALKAVVFCFGGLFGKKKIKLF